MTAARRTFVGLILLATGAGPAAAADPAPPGRVLPVAIQGGRGEVVLATPNAGDKFYLLVGCLAQDTALHRVTVRTAPAAGPASVPLDTAAPDPDWRRRTAPLHEVLARARRDRPPAPEPRPAEPPRQRRFCLFIGEHDFHNPESYVTVTADLRAAGRHCLAYVDHDYPDPDALQPTVADAVAAFDRDIYPQARRRLGRALDVDGDGRFTILFSGWLARLSRGKVALGGFVRGSDFYRDLAAPFGNRCDMLYLNTDLRPGPHLRTLLAHEYTHAVVFSEHLFGGWLPGGPRQEEESWLNEAVAHLNEDLHGYGWSNLDYRISAFLSAPERYPLVVPDYYGTNLWRTPGTRGAAYLFLRWCADRHGADLLPRLVQTSLSGPANVEAATQERFADLFRQWSAALALGGAGLPAEGTTPLKRIDPRQPLGDRLLCGPRFTEVPLSGGRHEAEVSGTAVAYLLLHSPAGPCSRVTVTADPSAGLQVTLIRLPAEAPRLSLRCEAGERPGTVRLALTAPDAAVRLEAAAWERLSPAGKAEDTSYRPGHDGVREWFGDERLKAGECRRSRIVELPRGEGPWVVKVIGRDAAGRAAAAWDTLHGQPERQATGIR